MLTLENCLIRSWTAIYEIKIVIDSIINLIIVWFHFLHANKHVRIERNFFFWFCLRAHSIQVSLDKPFKQFVLWHKSIPKMYVFQFWERVASVLFWLSFFFLFVKVFCWINTKRMEKGVKNEKQQPYNNHSQQANSTA